MSIRALDFLDLPVIARYRNDVLTLDSTRALTRGHPLGAGGLLAYINPSRHVYAAIANDGAAKLLGGIIHTRGEPFAKLWYLAPSSHLDDTELPALLEHLCVQAGRWKAMHVIAEIDELSDVFPALRVAGFSVYAWQRQWEVGMLEEAATGPRSEWRRMRSVDLPAVQNLHYQIVPQLLHPIEPAPTRVSGFVHASDMKAYAGISSGMYGIVLTPLIHPEENDVGHKLATLIHNLPDRRGRRVFLNVRSYQTWLEPAVADLGAQSSQRQAVMVKHLARLVKNGMLAQSVPSRVGMQATRITRIDIDEQKRQRQ